MSISRFHLVFLWYFATFLLLYWRYTEVHAKTKVIIRASNTFSNDSEHWKQKWKRNFREVKDYLSSATQVTFFVFAISFDFNSWLSLSLSLIILHHHHRRFWFNSSIKLDKSADYLTNPSLRTNSHPYAFILTYHKNLWIQFLNILAIPSKFKKDNWLTHFFNRKSKFYYANLYFLGKNACLYIVYGKHKEFFLFKCIFISN